MSNIIKRFYLLFFVMPLFGAYTENILNSCGNYHDMLAVFTPNSYTCDPGYFLPANTQSCQECPNGYTCSGGTYSFNSTQSQGLVKSTNYTTQNLVKSCASNAPHAMVAIFTPNTINIEWYDGDTKITPNNSGATTCTYDGEITIPTNTPTKEGYTFTGWQVRTM